MKHKHIEDENFKDFIYDNLIVIENIELLILKGHVLIEYSINKYIQELSDKEFDIYDENLLFIQKIKISKSLGLFNGAKQKELLDLLLHLNKIRNTVAHFLEFDKNEINKLIINFQKFNHEKKIIKITDEEDIRKKLIEMINSLCGFIIGTKQSQLNIKKFTHSILKTLYNKNPEKFMEALKKMD